MNDRNALPWVSAFLAVMVIQVGVFLGSPSGAEAVRGFLEEGEATQPRTTMTMAEAYGQRFSEFAVICPADSPQDVARNLGGEAPALPDSGIPPSRNHLILRTADGKTEWRWVRREMVDFCGDLGGMGLRPIDDHSVLLLDEETGRWRLDR